MMEEFEIDEKVQNADSCKKLAIILGMIGIILIIVGVAIATIHSSLRGSCLGPLLVADVVLLIIAILILIRKRA